MRDRLVNMFAETSAAHKGNGELYQNLKAKGFTSVLTEMTSEYYQLLGYAYKKVSELTHPPGTGALAGQSLSKSMQGLVALIFSYLRMANSGFNGGAYPYPKAFTILLARTDFASMFNSIDSTERDCYKANPRLFSDMLTTAANLPPDAEIITKGIQNIPNDSDSGIYRIPVTRAHWLYGITQGVDLLSKNPKFESMGSLGSKTDKVGSGNTHKGVVLELRKNQQAMPYTQWKSFAENVFAYLIDLNSRAFGSEAEEEQAYQDYWQQRQDEI